MIKVVMENEYYFTFNRYLKEHYNKRVWRLPLSTGYPCPNRLDGKSGCTFCDGVSFLPKYLREPDTLENQIERGMKFFADRYEVDFFYGYFQFNSSTYGPIDELIEKYKTVLENQKILGLIISTRPDCINNEILSKIALLNKDYEKDIWIELGLQSVYDVTLERIKRNHTFFDFKKAVELIKENSNFKITVHMIIGLPGETPEMIREGIKILFDNCKIDGIKFRLLEIIAGTEMFEEFKKNSSDFYKFDIDSYSKVICDMLELTPSNVVVMRLTNFNALKLLRKSENDKIPTREDVVELINREFEKRGTKQGAFFKKIV